MSAPPPRPGGPPATTGAAPRPRAALRVGLFCPSWPTGANANGVVTYVDAVAAQLHATGHPVTVLAGEVMPGAAAPDVASLSEARRPWAFPDRALQALLRRTLPDLAAIREWRSFAGAARKLVEERGVGVVETEEALGIAYWVERALSIPVVVRLHGPWFLNGVALGVPEDAAFRRRVEAERRAIVGAAAITAPSRDVLDRVRRQYGLPLEGAAVIPNPGPVVAPADRWRLEGCDRHRLLFIGRFDRHKGGDLVLEAFGQVWRAYPEARLSFVGPDRGLKDATGRLFSLAEYVRERLPDAMAAGAVALLGQKPPGELPALRRGALATIVCSRYENFPSTLVEAVSLGCPTIAADTGGIPEIVQDGVTGLLHRAGDAAHLAARMLEVLRDPLRAAGLGDAAARAAERFHPQAIVPRLLELYRSVVQA